MYAMPDSEIKEKHDFASNFRADMLAHEFSDLVKFEKTK